MSLVCAQCSRVNPADAAYCYHDGAALAGRVGGPVHAGSAAFPSPFVFPDGTACRNFDQLAMACQERWASAVELLKEGFLGGFFGSVGRVDLAMAAKEAAQFPDPDRGLDQLLAKLPSQALQAPKLKAEPREINLGQMKVGDVRDTELHLTNLGMRLVYGTVASDCKWLAFGDGGPGSEQKLFQFGAEAILPVHVVGKNLRAGTKPLEGRLLVESNGGSATVTVRAEVPITPFPGGLFAGAMTPRQVAEKAKAQPKDAAPYFEGGAVKAWYESNGWPYPVKGPTMPGTGAIQQFFEALGVAKAPRVEIGTKEITLSGDAGQALTAQIDVSSPEKKIVYAWASCDQPWVEFGTSKLNGRTAAVPVTVRVPNAPGQTLEAKVHVTANGNQKFAVPLRLTVVKGDPTLPPTPAAASAATVDAAPFETLGFGPATAAGPPADDNPFAIDAPAIPSNVATLPPAAATAPLPAATTGPAPPPTPVAPQPGRWMHLAPLGLLGLVLLGVVARDLFVGATAGVGGGSDVDPTRRIAVNFDYNFGKAAKGAKVTFSDRMTFGIAKLDPDNRTGPGRRLIYGDFGHTNSTILLVDGKERVFGHRAAGRWIVPPRDVGRYGGKTATYQFKDEPIAVTQEVSIVPGESIEVAPEEYRRLLDTCLVKYKVENRDRKPHQVGLRVLLDTYIIDNDGVPFTIPGAKELVKTQKDFPSAKEVPDFLQILERPDVKDPGTVAQLTLHISDRLDPPTRVSLTQWPGNALKDHWKVPMQPMSGDSAVVIYWDQEELAPGKSREMGFTYGLGSVSAERSTLGVTVGGSTFVGGDLTVVALVAEPKAQTIRLDLPPGLSLHADTPAVQDVPPREKTPEGVRAVPVTWRVRADGSGEYNLVVTTDPEAAHSVQQTRRVKILPKSLYQ